LRKKRAKNKSSTNAPFYKVIKISFLKKHFLRKRLRTIFFCRLNPNLIWHQNPVSLTFQVKIA